MSTRANKVAKLHHFYWRPSSIWTLINKQTVPNFKKHKSKANPPHLYNHSLTKNRSLKSTKQSSFNLKKASNPQKLCASRINSSTSHKSKHPSQTTNTILRSLVERIGEILRRLFGRQSRWHGWCRRKLVNGKWSSVLMIWSGRSWGLISVKAFSCVKVLLNKVLNLSGITQTRDCMRLNHPQAQ